MLIAAQSKSNFTKIKFYNIKHRKKIGYPSHLINLFHKPVKLYEYSVPDALDYLVKKKALPKDKMCGVVSFYSYSKLKLKGKFTFSTSPRAIYTINGAKGILNTIIERLNINISGTIDDTLFTIKEARCLEASRSAPVIIVNKKTYCQITENKAQDIIKNYITQSRQEGFNE